MRYEAFLLILCVVAQFMQASCVPKSDKLKKSELLMQLGSMKEDERLEIINLSGAVQNLTRSKRSADRFARDHRKRKALQEKSHHFTEKDRRRRRYLMKQLRKAERRAKLDGAYNVQPTRQSRAESSLEATQQSQNELLSTIDDLPRRSAVVEISVKDPGMCKVDGVPMCKNGGECMARDEGGAPVFFCACQPAWDGDFCHEERDPCSPGLPDCGSMFSCHRDESNHLAGFSCHCDDRLGWTRRSESDPRCIRITRCSEGNPCQNGGSCRQEEGGFVCVCLEHSYGDLCEHPRLPGDSKRAAAAAAAAGPLPTLYGAAQLLPAAQLSASIDLKGARGAAAPGSPANGAGFAGQGLPVDGAWDPAGYAGGAAATFSGDPAALYGRSPGSVYSQGPGAMYSQSPGAPYGQGPGAMYGQGPGAVYGPWPAAYGPGPAAYGAGLAERQAGASPADRRRRSHVALSRRSARRRRRQKDFLERLFRDVAPQIRRTARDSVIELPSR